MTHCVNIWVRDFYDRHAFLSMGALATFLDQLSRFTVPAFFLLSGYGLAMQQISTPLPLGQFYRRRVPRILLPFLLWSALTSYRFWGFFAELPWKSAPLRALGHSLDLIFLKGFDYQYYFLIVIFQFYLIFPFLYKWARHRSFLVVVLLIQIALMSPIEAWLGLFGLALPPLYSYLLFFFLFYCVAGVHAAWNPTWVSGIVGRMTLPQIWFLWFATLGMVSAEFWVNIALLKKPLMFADHFNRWVVLAYCCASLLLLLKYRDYLKARVHFNARWQWYFKWVTPFSFFVYLVHTHVLRFVELFLHGLHPVVFVLRVALVLIGSYALAWVSQRLFAPFPGLRHALGLPREAPPTAAK